MSADILMTIIFHALLSEDEVLCRFGHKGGSLDFLFLIVFAAYVLFYFY